MDLTTTYLGMKLRSPLVPSASPLSVEVDNLKRMQDAGAAAVVLQSLFEESWSFFMLDAELRGETEKLEQLYRSRFRFLNTYSALWLSHQSRGGLTPL